MAGVVGIEPNSFQFPYRISRISLNHPILTIYLNNCIRGYLMMCLYHPTIKKVCRLFMNRFLEQNVFTKKQIQRAMDNTDLLLKFDDYDILPDGSPNPIFSKDIKLPTLYDGEHVIDGVLLPKLTQEERNKEYSKLITRLFKEYVNDVPPEQYDEYFEGVKTEVQVIKDTNMSDYFLIDYYMVDHLYEN